MNTHDPLNDLAVSDRGFVFDPYSGGTFSVNTTGLSVLRALQQGEGRHAIEAVLRDTFEVFERDLRRDVDEFVQLLREHRLVPLDYVLPDGDIP